VPHKPTVYLDTSLISAYWYESNDVVVMSRRWLTRQWWDEERKHFSLLALLVTEDELRAGEFPRQADCLKMIRRLRYLPISRFVSELSETLLTPRPCSRFEAARRPSNGNCGEQ
jgi:hypothetical protein